MYQLLVSIWQLSYGSLGATERMYCEIYSSRVKLRAINAVDYECIETNFPPEEARSTEGDGLVWLGGK